MEEPTKPLRLVVVTGMSGAGRSTAAHSLEDLGWYVVDNLPPSVLPEVCDQARQIGLTRVAVVLDVRTRGFFEQLPTHVRRPERRSASCRRSCSWRRPTTSSSGVRSRYAGRTRCRATAGCWTASAGSARPLATLRAAADLVIDTSSTEHPPAALPGQPCLRRQQRRPAPGHPADLRLQERDAGRRRHGLRRPLPAQPALGARAAAADRAEQAGQRLRAAARPGPRSSWPRCRGCSVAVRRLHHRGQAVRHHRRSAAPAASTAAPRSPRSSAGRLRAGGCRPRCCTATWAGSDAARGSARHALGPRAPSGGGLRRRPRAGRLADARCAGSPTS